jgi:hypothetical protein
MSSACLPAVIHSPRAPPSPVAVLSSGASVARSGQPGTPLVGGGLGGMLSGGYDGGDEGEAERYESQWQQVEELYCPLVSISAADAAGGGASSGGGGGPQVRPLTGDVELPPGRSLLTFLAAPVKRGLYKALHLRAALQRLPLRVAVAAPQPLWGPPHGSLADAAAAAAAPAAEAIYMRVEQAQPRLELGLVAAGGSLVAGQEQWLGLALAPGRDALRDAQLQLTWPVGHPGSGGLGEWRAMQTAHPSHLIEIGWAALPPLSASALSCIRAARQPAGAPTAPCLLHSWVPPVPPCCRAACRASQAYRPGPPPPRRTLGRRRPAAGGRRRRRAAGLPRGAALCAAGAPCGGAGCRRRRGGGHAA